jgi:hypothetical protein
MGSKKAKDRGRRLDVTIDTNIVDAFYGVIKHQGVLLNRTIEGVARFWIALPTKEQASLIIQRQQLGGLDGIATRRICARISAQIIDEFYQRVEAYGCSKKCAFEAAIRGWMSLPIERQRDFIRREENTIIGD